MIKPYKFEPDYAVPPGATIAETLREKGIAPEDFSDRMGLTGCEYARLISGDLPIDDKMAMRLKEITGIPHTFWCNRERSYRETVKRLSTKQAT